ncbi:MAG TPA: superoxide dismutase family protein [Candidatus Acidoferrum sp.]|nr:superoxide dismutase family protein [Candidatus Acidoferrum sp.]
MKILPVLVGSAVLACGTAALWSSIAAAAPKPVVIDIKNATGQSIGTATLTDAAPGVRIKLDIKSLPPGEHSIHIHQLAKCEAPDFKSAGPHFTGAAGGHDHSGAPAGDIPNFVLVVGADGTAHVSVVAPNVTLGSDDHSVFSNGGTALVIHAVSSSTDSGAPPRIACGLISKPA